MSIQWCWYLFSWLRLSESLQTPTGCSGYNMLLYFPMAFHLSQSTGSCYLAIVACVTVIVLLAHYAAHAVELSLQLQCNAVLSLSGSIHVVHGNWFRRVMIMGKLALASSPGWPCLAAGTWRLLARALAPSSPFSPCGVFGAAAKTAIK